MDNSRALNPKDLLTTAQVVEKINANNLKLPTLWAALNYSVTIIDEKSVSHTVSSDDGTMVAMAPGFFKLHAEKEFVGPIFDLGTNQDEFWLEIIPGMNTLYRGKLDLLAKLSAAEKKQVPIRPDLIRDVLGIGLIGPNLVSTPVPIMRFDPPSDSYIILFGAQVKDHWVAQKQIWYDRQTIRPRRVIVYGDEGKPELDAELSHDMRVSVANVPAEQWPQAAGNYRIFLPSSGSHMEITIKDVRLFAEIRGGVHIPNANTFGVPDVSGTDTRTIYVPSSALD